MEKLALHTRLEVANHAFTEEKLSTTIAESISTIHAQNFHDIPPDSDN